MAEPPNGEPPFKQVSFDSEAARKRKPKSLKQILEQMSARYGSDANYQAFNWTSVLAAPSVRPRRKYCDITGLVVTRKYTGGGLEMTSNNIFLFAHVGSLQRSKDGLAVSQRRCLSIYKDTES